MRERASGGRAAIFLSGEAREEFASGEAASDNSTLHQSSHGFAARVHGFATKTKALTHAIPPATQATPSPSSLLKLPININAFLDECNVMPLN